MKNAFYSPSYAGESILKQAVMMRKALINEAIVVNRKDLEKRIEEISRINKLSFGDLKKEFLS